MKAENLNQTDETKAIDQLIWTNFIGRKTNEEYGIFDFGRSRYSIDLLKNAPFGWGETVLKVRKKNYKFTRSKHFKKIIEDDDRLEHWIHLIQELKKIDTDLLKFILEKKVPLEKFIEKALLEKQ